MPTATPTADRPLTDRPLAARLRRVATLWARSQYELVTLAADFADSGEWALDGSPTPAHWLAAVADVETCTTREWIRVGRALRTLPATADAFARHEISYAKVRTLTRLATPENEAELLEIARTTPANHLPRALAHWLNRTTDPASLDDHQHRRRSVTRRTEPDGMTVYTCRLPPLPAAHLDAALTTRIMRSRPRPNHDGDWPTLGQQYADALTELLTHGTGPTVTEIVLHIRGDGCTLDDGTPVPSTVVERIAPEAFLRALIHDAEGRPVDASNRRRHPTTRQQRVVHERDRACLDCGEHHLLHYDHVPAWEQTHHTVTTELQLRCAPCHRRRHTAPDRPRPPLTGR
ncbi:MAG: DUF222 domain-containing protein [Acidimicrobiales bacterium]